MWLSLIIAGSVAGLLTALAFYGKHELDKQHEQAEAEAPDEHFGIPEMDSETDAPETGDSINLTHDGELD